ncbi:MAG TPA: DUF3501 family protein [Gammaproteobacteria bacterium]|nr:DUF3501 family protein [Gammaproteobacteria bacterium]
MNKPKNSTVKIGSNVSLLVENLSTLNSVIPEKNNLKATMSVKFSDEKIIKEKLNQFSGIENKVWLQVGENDRILASVQKTVETHTEKKTSSNYFLCFEFTNLMIKDLQSGATLFAGVEHPNYNVRTQEIPRTVSDLLAQDLSK